MLTFQHISQLVLFCLPSKEKTSMGKTTSLIHELRSLYPFFWKPLPFRNSPFIIPPLSYTSKKATMSSSHPPTFESKNLNTLIDLRNFLIYLSTSISRNSLISLYSSLKIMFIARKKFIYRTSLNMFPQQNLSKTREQKKSRNFPRITLCQHRVKSCDCIW